MPETMPDKAVLADLGIDADEGLAYCADDPEFYAEMLGEYAREGQEGAVELARFFEARDWEAYRIRAHSIKSTSRMIGARGLSERARELEFAAKEGDAVRIEAEHAPFATDYAALVDGIKALFG